MLRRRPPPAFARPNCTGLRGWSPALAADAASAAGSPCALLSGWTRVSSSASRAYSLRRFSSTESQLCRSGGR